MPLMHLVPRGRDLLLASPPEFLAFVVAYADLLAARWAARAQALAAHQAAVPFGSFCERGVEGDILLWMLYQDHIDHWQSAGEPDRTGCAPALVHSLVLTAGSSFALTERGDAFANGFLLDTLFPADDEAFVRAWERLLLGRLVPHYDPGNHLFAWGRHLLKCFRQPAANQQLLLAAAEEMGWEDWMDDPLPLRPGKSPKAVLHDTLKDLNRRQRRPLIQFKGDGTGTRFGWEYR
jgi:hypothetical protein